MVKVLIPFLLHIKDAIDSITEYIGDYNFNQFKSDQKTQDAVIRQLEIIGESTTRLESEIKTEHPEISWREMPIFVCFST